MTALIRRLVLMALAAAVLCTAMAGTASAHTPVIPKLRYSAPGARLIHYKGREAILIKSVRVWHARGISVYVECTRKKKRCPRTTKRAPKIKVAKRGAITFRRADYVMRAGAKLTIIGMATGELGRYAQVTVRKAHGKLLPHTRPLGCLLALNHIVSCKGKVKAPPSTVTTSGSTAPPPSTTTPPSTPTQPATTTPSTATTTTGAAPSAPTTATTVPAGGTQAPSVTNYSISGVVKGSGTISGAGVSCPGTCASTHTAGSAVTLTATPGVGQVFSGWSGPCTGTSPTCTIVLNGNEVVIATFVTASETLTVDRSGPGQGSITGGGISCGGTCSVTVPYGTAITLSASWPWDVRFGAWQGAGCSGTGQCTIVMTSNVTVGAPFSGYYETAGSAITSVWTNPYDGGGSPGPAIGSGATVQVQCYVTGLRVADGNTNWYLLAGTPYYTSADPYYNDGATSGALKSTPYVDPAVPHC